MKKKIKRFIVSLFKEDIKEIIHTISYDIARDRGLETAYMKDSASDLLQRLSDKIK